MKARVLFLVALVAVGAINAAPGEDPVLAGLLAGQDTTVIVLAEMKTKSSSPWLKVGQTWHDYRVIGIDPKAGSAVLAMSGERVVTVSLKESHVQEEGAAASSPKTVTPTLVAGTYQIVNGKTVYSPDAVVSLGDLSLKAFDGVLQLDGTTIQGNVEILRPDGGRTMAENAIVRFSEGKPMISAQKIRMLLRGKQDEPAHRDAASTAK